MSRNDVARKLLDSAADLSATYFSQYAEVTQLNLIGYTIETSGVTTNTGSFSIQARNTDLHNNTSAWIDITSAGSYPLANANQNIAVALSGFPWNEVRLKFVPAGGTPNGTAKIFITVKRAGG